MAELEVRNLTKKFKRKTVLNDISITLEPGIYGLLGLNGSGKTTLIRCLCKIYKTPKGTISYDGRDWDFSQKIGYLPQNFGLFRDMKVKDMLELMAYVKGNSVVNQNELDEVLGRVNLLERKNDKISALSGGMVRRLGIAQALLNNPEIIIFDEPTTGLDPEERVRFKEIIKGLSRDKIIIISTHITADVEDICNKCIILNAGGIVFADTVNNLKSHYNSNTIEEAFLCALKD